MAVDLSLKVLIIDDHRTMLRIIRGQLKELGFRDIDEASNGGEALDKLRGGEFGLVLSDWNMSPMSGLELLKEIRSDQILKGVPFVMVTAESSKEHVVEAKKAGVSNYIIKPFNADTLKSKIATVLGDF